MLGNVAPALRVISLVGLACCGATLGAETAFAADTTAHIDLSQPHPQPPYPDSARAGSEQGTVLVNVEVKPSGHLGKFRVAQSSGFGDLDNAAVQSVLNWHFVPATENGDTVTGWTTVKIVFELPQTADNTSAPPSH